LELLLDARRKKKLLPQLLNSPRQNSLPSLLNLLSPLSLLRIRLVLLQPSNPRQKNPLKRSKKTQSKKGAYAPFFFIT
jgi:hypothetical protein